MLSRFKSMLVSVASLAAISLYLMACGNNVAGVYSGNGESFFEKLVLNSGGKVQVTFMGMTKEGTFEVNGKQVKITVGGENQVLTIDDKGCLQGGAMIGRYCRDGATASAPKSTAGFGALSGIYQVGDAHDGITLEFQSGGKVRVTVSGESHPDDGNYTVKGNQITITVPGGMPITLTNQGTALVGSLGGQSVRFMKQ